MLPRPLVVPVLAMAFAILRASTALGQHVEVPSFTVGSPATDFGVLTSGVAPGAHGDFVTIWEEFLRTDHTAPLLRAFTNRQVTLPPAFGQPHRRERMLNLLTKPAIVAVPGGYFDVWIQIDNDPAVFGLRLDATGTPIGTEFQITDSRHIDWLGHEVAATAFQSGVVFFWYESGSGTQRVRARLYDLDGTPRAPSFDVDVTAEPYVDAVELADGGFLLAWGGAPAAGTGSFGRAYLPTGAPRGDPFTFSNDTRFRRLAVSPDGWTVTVAGVRAVSSSTPNEIWAGRYAINGTPRADEFLVYAAGGGISVNPDVDFDLAGNLYVTWTETFLGTQARGFDGQDVALGPPVQIGSDLAFELHTARLSDNRFVNVLTNTGAAPGSVQATIVSLCTPGTAVCGDGVIRSECELCDDGAANSDTVADACRTTCRPASCGDGVVDTGEECDDGNHENCDGCSASCAAESGLGCGDGIPNLACGEPCDDGNATVGDGCSPACVLERVPGGGSPITDCYTEWVVDNPTNEPLLEDGAFRRLQICRDGDPRCDFDPTPGICGFRVRMCANNTDVMQCTAGTRLSSWKLVQPSATKAAKHPVVAAARAALLDAIPAAVVGPSARDVCSPVADVPVEMRDAGGRYQTGKLTVKTIATQYDGSRDSDSLRLECVP